MLKPEKEWMHFCTYIGSPVCRVAPGIADCIGHEQVGVVRDLSYNVALHQKQSEPDLPAALICVAAVICFLTTEDTAQI